MAGIFGFDEEAVFFAGFSSFLVSLAVIRVILVPGSLAGFLSLAAKIFLQFKKSARRQAVKYQYTLLVIRRQA